MRYFFFLLFLCTYLFSEAPFLAPEKSFQLIVQNRPLVKVNQRIISVMDVKKRMDVLFDQYYPQYRHSQSARFEFYTNSWLHTLQDMIDTELILADAEIKEIKISSGDVREEIEYRYGPNIMSRLDELGLTYEEAREMVQNEMIVRQMNWYKVQAKAQQSVTPQDIKEAYKKFISEHPPTEELTYQILSIRGNNCETFSKKVHEILFEMKDIQKAYEELSHSPDCPEGATLQLSEEFKVDAKSLSNAYFEILKPLLPGQYSLPIFQVSRADGKSLFRIFYLQDRVFHTPPSFQEMFATLSGELLQKSLEKENTLYITKLRSRHGFDEKFLKAMIPSDFKPFSLK